jgi:hypothetical protein
MRRAFRIRNHCKTMGKPGNNVHIPLSTEKAIGLLLQVRPTKDMPRPGAHPTKARMAQLDEEFGPLKLGKRKKP